MRGRLLPIMLALLLFAALIGCQTQADPSPTPEVSPSLPEPTVTAPPAASPIVTPTPTPTPSPSATDVESDDTPSDIMVYLPNGLPERPDYDSGEVGTRYYKDTTLSLRAKPDYGRLYPYIGAMVDRGWFVSEPWLYGLCNAKGKIVCDPVYNKVEILEKDGYQVYLLQRFGVEATIAALDSSWVRTYQDCEFQPESSEYDPLRNPPDTDYISVKGKNGWGCVDYTGREVYPCRERFPVQFCEGLAVVWSKDSSEYSYINVNGDTMLGPYPAPVELEESPYLWQFEQQRLYFKNGLARFCQDDMWGFIDKRGNVMIEPQFAEASPFFGDYAVAMDSVWQYGVIDRDGRWIVTPSDRHSVTAVDTKRFLYYEYSASSESYKLMDAAGMEIPMSIHPHRLLDNGWFLEYKDYKVSRDYNTRVEKNSKVIELSEYVQVGLPNDRFLAEIYENDDTFWTLLDDTGKQLTKPAIGYAWVTKYGKLRTSIHLDEQQNYKTLFGITDTDGTVILPLEYDYVVDWDGFYAVQQGSFAGLVDNKGNWIVKRSLLDSTND